jgi:hypothetical protein
MKMFDRTTNQTNHIDYKYTKKRDKCKTLTPFFVLTMKTLNKQCKYTNNYDTTLFNSFVRTSSAPSTPMIL